MERYVVLADELEELHFVGALPPILPVEALLVARAGSYRYITDGRVEPNVEDLVLEARLGHRDAHLRSRVMARSLRPSRIQAWVICIALLAQKPSTLAFFIQASSTGRIAGRSM